MESINIGTKTVAIILAGGNGSRMGSSKPKQLRKINGIPIIIRSVQAFQLCPDIDSIIIASRREDIETIYDLCEKYSIGKLQKIVPGGETRLHSASAGFEADETCSKMLAIHDAARCLITSDIIWGHLEFA